jgi:hypothetical protein
VSGWFEPAERFVNLSQSLPKELEALKKEGLPTGVHLEDQKVQPWREVVTYEIPLEGGASAHIRASYVGHGTWIDIHVSLSQAGTYGDAEAAVISFFRQIQVTERQ